MTQGAAPVSQISRRGKTQMLLVAKGIATRSKGLTTRNKQLVETIYKLELKLVVKEATRTFSSLVNKDNAPFLRTQMPEVVLTCSMFSPNGLPLSCSTRSWGTENWGSRQKVHALGTVVFSTRFLQTPALIGILPLESVPWVGRLLLTGPLDRPDRR